MWVWVYSYNPYPKNPKNLGKTQNPYLKIQIFWVYTQNPNPKNPNFLVETLKKKLQKNLVFFGFLVLGINPKNLCFLGMGFGYLPKTKTCTHNFLDVNACSGRSDVKSFSCRFGPEKHRAKPPINFTRDQICGKKFWTSMIPGYVCRDLPLWGSF